MFEYYIIILYCWFPECILVYGTCYASITTHTVHIACTHTLSICSFFSTNVWSVLVEVNWLCIIDPEKKLLCNLATKDIQHPIARHQTQDTAMESQCSINWANKTAEYLSIHDYSYCNSKYNIIDTNDIMIKDSTSLLWHWSFHQCAPP